MRIIATMVIVLVLATFSLGWAEEEPLSKAYSLYFQGKMRAAIKIFEEYVKDHPDPKVMYYLGYAYYKIKKMDKAIRYFDEAYLIDPDFTPIPKRKASKPEVLILK